MVDRDVVVVTGASAGVGRATARRFAERGAAVALLARGEKGLAGAAEEVRAAGGTPLVVPVDVAEHKEVFAAADRVERELGPIRTWVNVAFSSVFAPVTEISPEEYRRVTEVTYLGYVYGTKAALARMLPLDQGTIVQVGSALAYRGIPLQSAYCAAKHAIQGFHDSLRTELLRQNSNVRVTMVQLPAVNTPQFDWVLSRLPHRPQPVPPIYQPELIARGIVHAAGTAFSRFPTVASLQTLLQLGPGGGSGPNIAEHSFARRSSDCAPVAGKRPMWSATTPSSATPSSATPSSATPSTATRQVR